MFSSFRSFAIVAFLSSLVHSCSSEFCIRLCCELCALWVLGSLPHCLTDVFDSALGFLLHLGLGLVPVARVCSWLVCYWRFACWLPVQLVFASDLPAVFKCKNIVKTYSAHATIPSLVCNLIDISHEPLHCKVNTEATDFANELASTQPQRLDANVELFQLNGFLARDYAKSGTALFSRKATRVAWDAVFQLLEQDKMDRIAMLGMPGIGKSRSLFYGLWRLMTRKVPPVVVFEARRRQKVFIFTLQNNQWVVRSIDTNDWKPGSCKYLQDERNFYLIDAFAPEQWDAILPAKTIKACFPDRRHHSGFVKDGGTYVYVEAWSAEEVKAAHPYLEGAPELTEMLERFEQVGGNLRVLLSSINDYDSYVWLQKNDAKKFENFESAVWGDLNTEGAKIMTRLFTYLSPNGRSIAVSFCSEKAKMLVLDKHYDELMKTWSTPNDPRAFYLFEQFAGTIFTSSLLEGRLLEGYSITRSDGGWTYEKCGPLPGGRQLLECDAEGTFDDRWREAVRKGDLGEVLLHSPDKYPGIDYLLDFNHGIQVTLSENHNIAKTFLDKLEKAFEGQKDYSFTLTFW